MVEVEEYKRDLLNESIEDVYMKYIIAGDVWYFKEQFGDCWFEKYNDFKIFISQKLGVHYNDIAIAGSAKVGFSLNPDKNYKEFNEKSDIDVIIISQPLFYKFWKSYLCDSYSALRVKNYYYVCSCIFRKFITFEGFNSRNEDFRIWQKQTMGFEKDLQLRFNIANEIHYRIYESWEAAQMYYIGGMQESKNKLEALEDGNK